MFFCFFIKTYRDVSTPILICYVVWGEVCVYLHTPTRLPAYIVKKTFWN